MHSEKRVSITAKAMSLIFALLNVTLSSDVPFNQPAAVPKLASWFYQSLSLFSFVLHSILHCCVDDDLKYACYGFSASSGASYVIPCLECYLIANYNY